MIDMETLFLCERNDDKENTWIVKQTQKKKNHRTNTLTGKRRGRENTICDKREHMKRGEDT